MPCIVYDDEIMPHERHGGETPHVAKLKEERKKARSRANRATKLLCFVCNKLEAQAVNRGAPAATQKMAQEILDEPELKAWWEQHKKEDEERRKRKKRKKAEQKRKKREEKKKLKESALKKLSKKEREALGL